jgi:glycosyltransferase involved in cell wall biosynthesis
MKVSVVVPLYNTGEAVQDLIDSLRAQTLATDEWEAVFVDDGSSDDTPDVVEGLIADAPNMRLLREAPSGWPGRPRNVGLDHAKGDYVFFSDDDDTLGPEALERLTAFAVAHGSDVVVPRTVGRNRGVPAIAHTVVDAQDEPGLIMSSLAPQKLFRRAFLQEHGIRFVEGHFRLEDHLFVTTSYLWAKRVSVYADYPCYYLTFQSGRPHISQQQPDWHAYFGSIRACLDRVDAEARDDTLRRAMRSRWLRAEALSRLRGDGYTKLGTPELVHEVRQLLLERYDAAEVAALKPIDRMLAVLLLDGRDEDVAALAAWESSALVTSEVTGAEVGLDGAVRIGLRSALALEGAPPAAIAGDARYPSEAELLEQISASTHIGVELQHGSTKVRQPLAVTHQDDGVAVAVLAPGGEPLATGRWTVMALAGEHRTRRRRAADATEELALAEGSRRVGEQKLGFVNTGKVVLRVQRYVAPLPVPLRTRIKRRVRRMLPADFRVPRLLRAAG